MRTEYINIFLAQSKILDEINALYEAYNKKEAVDFISKYEVDELFSDASSLVNSVRGVISQFESVVKKEDENPRLIDLWRLRHEEVFVLKYLCVNSLFSGDDFPLLLFCSKFIDKSATSLKYTLFRIPSRYDQFLLDIKSIIQQIDNDKSYFFSRESKIDKVQKEIEVIQEKTGAKIEEVVLLLRDESKLFQAEAAKFESEKAVMRKELEEKDALISEMNEKVVEISSTLKVEIDKNKCLREELSRVNNKLEIMDEENKADKANMLAAQQEMRESMKSLLETVLRSQKESVKELHETINSKTLEVEKLKQQYEGRISDCVEEIGYLQAQLVEHGSGPSIIPLSIFAENKLPSFSPYSVEDTSVLSGAKA